MGRRISEEVIRRLEAYATAVVEGVRVPAEHAHFHFQIDKIWGRRPEGDYFNRCYGNFEQAMQDLQILREAFPEVGPYFREMHYDEVLDDSIKTGIVKTKESLEKIAS